MRKKFFVALALFLMISAGAFSATYYVSKTGSDSYNGLAPAPGVAPNGPFLTFQKAANALRAGDTVMIRGGVYNTYAGSWGYLYDGTQDKPVTIMPYNGEKVVIDGLNFTVPSSKDPLMQIYGDWYVIRDIEFRYGHDTGLNIIGDHVTAQNIYSHHNWGSGMYASGDYTKFYGCIAHDCSLMNEKGVMKIGWGFGISLVAGSVGSSIRNCAAWNNWGEGLSVQNTDDCSIEYSVAYNNYTVNIYVMNSRGTMVRNNLSYFDADNPIRPYTSSQNCLYSGDENTLTVSGRNIFMYNRCLGGDRSLLIGGRYMAGTFITDNVFANVFNRASSDPATVYFLGGASKGGYFVNNTIIQSGDAPICKNSSTGVYFGTNRWSRRPIASMAGPGDFTFEK